MAIAIVAFILLILILIVIDVGCFALLIKVKGSREVRASTFILPGLAMYKYYKYKKEHIK